jgi:hypothetical protein
MRKRLLISVNPIGKTPIRERVLANHHRVASKDPGVGLPTGEIRTEIVCDKVALISVSNVGPPVVYTAPLAYRMMPATAGEIAKLNGAAAPVDPFAMMLDAMALLEEQIHDLDATYEAKINALRAQVEAEIEAELNSLKTAAQ